MEKFRLSVSKTKTFLDCKKKYKFTYIDKLPRKEWDYHILGKFCHKVLEDFHNFYIIDNSNEPFHIAMKRAYKQAMQEYGLNMTNDMRKTCREMINQYLQIITNDKKNHLSANVVACEKSFSMLLDDQLVLNGAIDRIQIDQDNVIHVCDYKTSKSKTYLKNDFFQLLTYAYVILSDNLDVEKIRASYIMLRHDFEYITTEFLAKDILAIKDQYIEYANKIQQEQDFEANPTFLCKYCDHLEVCDEGQNKVHPKQVFGEIEW